MTIVDESTQAAQSNRATPRTWVRRIEGGGQVTETCPSTCTDAHLNDDHGALDDLQHGTSLPGVTVDVFDWTDGTIPMPVLSPRIAVDPYTTDLTRSVPHILLEVAQDEFTVPLDPERFAAVLAKIRAHCDQLEAEVLPQLRTAIVEHARTSPTSIASEPCAYCREPSVSVRTGELGNRYGLCADCQRTQDSMEAGA